MTTDAQRAFQLETDFLSGVLTNFEAAKGKQLRGSIWQLVRNDQSDRVRALLASNRIYDRERLKSLPANRRIVLRGYERHFLITKRETGAAIATVLSPLSHFASDDDGDAPAIGLGELVDHVRRLTADARVPQVVGVCSPTGFTDEAKAAKIDMPNVSVVLVEPDGHGGWQTSSSAEHTDARLLKLFDPEGTTEKTQRVRRVVEEHSADLLTGGLSASSVARKMGLPQHIVRDGMRELASADQELHVADKDGELLLFRGAPVASQERKSMNVIDRIKQLFGSEGDEGEKINVLAERRALLAQRRDRIYEDIGQLEKKEANLFEQGKAAKSQVPKRRIAAQLAQLRKDIGRQNTTAAMLNKQIDIISTDIHNLTLIQQGEMASLPDTETLTENAVKAEEMLETLQADAELVGSLETGIEETLISDDELAILKEFEADDAPAVADASSAPKQAATPIPPVATERGVARDPVEEPPSSDHDADQSRRADAEPT